MEKRNRRKTRALQGWPLLRGVMIPGQNGNNGFVLVGALLILVLLVLIGISSTTSTTLELQIAGAERARQDAFYHSDAGSEVGVQLLEENLACVALEAAGFFSAVIGSIQINDPVLSENIAPDPGTPPATPPHATYPAGSGNTNLTVSRTSAAAIAPEGTALRQITGYEHKGAGAGGGSGFYHRYNVYSQHQGMQNSESVVHVRWRHIVGLELDTCRY